MIDIDRFKVTESTMGNEFLPEDSLLKILDENRELFFLGPIRWKWITAAGTLPGHSLQLALVLALNARLQKSLSFRVRPTLVRSMGLSRFAYYRALEHLQNGGLLRILERSRGASAKVELLDIIPTTHSWD